MRRIIASISAMTMAPRSAWRLELVGNAAGRKAGDYISLQLDDPTFARPIRANLFQANEAGTAFDLLWNRPPRRHETA
jgi:uncharacterized protein (DUF736 family)